SATTRFYYPANFDSTAEAGLTLEYFNGTAWLPVQGSAGQLPDKNTTDNLDGTLSGGRFTATFDNTSTPSITELYGTVFITVQAGDTVPPSVQSISASPAILSPPNHKMVAVKITVRATDNVDHSPKSKIVSVSSNEP